MPTISIPTNYLVSMNKKYSLFCLPSAGSSASMYSLWSKYATDWLSVYPIEYPGHGTRCNEALIDNVDSLVGDVLEQILSITKENIILFGHSFGAALIWHLIKSLKQLKLERNIELVVLSGRPETSTLRNAVVHPSQWSQETILDKAKNYGGIPQLIIDDTEILTFFLKILQNDLCVNEDLINNDKLILERPLWVIIGNDDQVTTPHSVEMWKFWTTQWKGITSFPGGHFFLRDEDTIRKIIYGIQEIIFNCKKCKEY